MKGYIFSVLLLIITSKSVAQERVTLPTREECDACAVKSGNDEIAKYGSAEQFLSSVVVGGTSALLYSSAKLLEEAKKKKANIEKDKDLDPRTKYLLLRQGKNHANLARQTARFALRFPFKTAYLDAVLSIRFSRYAKEVLLLSSYFSAEMILLQKNHPEFKEAFTEAQLKMKARCNKMYANVIYRRKIKHPEDIFIKDGNYNIWVLPCAEFVTNFYSALDSYSQK